MCMDCMYLRANDKYPSERYKNISRNARNMSTGEGFAHNYWNFEVSSYRASRCNSDDRGNTFDSIASSNLSF